MSGVWKTLGHSRKNGASDTALTMSEAPAPAPVPAVNEEMRQWWLAQSAELQSLQRTIPTEGELVTWLSPRREELTNLWMQVRYLTPTQAAPQLAEATKLAGEMIARIKKQGPRERALAKLRRLPYSPYRRVR